MARGNSPYAIDVRRERAAERKEVYDRLTDEQKYQRAVERGHPLTREATRLRDKINGTKKVVVTDVTGVGKKDGGINEKKLKKSNRNKAKKEAKKGSSS